MAYEIKALIPVERAREVRAWARARMQPDPNAESGAGDVYRITSLYYDTDGFDVFHRRGSFGRSKYRVRRYDASQRVFLERKLRNESIVTKRRTRVDIDELAGCAIRNRTAIGPGHGFTAACWRAHEPAAAARSPTAARRWYRRRTRA